MSPTCIESGWLGSKRRFPRHASCWYLASRPPRRRTSIMVLEIQVRAVAPALTQSAGL
jgi:hypothetical protein